MWVAHGTAEYGAEHPAVGELVVQLNGEAEQAVPEVGGGQVADEGAGDTAGTSDRRHGVQYGRIAQRSDHDHDNKY